jgi:DNA primase
LVTPEADIFKRRVKDASDIVQVISERTSLVRSGRSFKGLCPFHEEKTPSFFVNPDGQFFKCFGCGKGGDVFTFVMETERVDFPQALTLLAERAHIPVPEYRGSRSPEEARLYEEGKNLLYRLNEFAARFFEERLWEDDQGAVAREYLQRRGIDREVAERFRLGFAPDSWDALSTELGRRKAAERHMVSAGLAVERKDATGVYDRFRNRLVFPIIDTSRRCVGFGARALSDADNPKYLNSPETGIFSKGRMLFGLPQARESMEGDRQVLLMEGYTDVIMSAQKGFTGAVATLGTSLTRDHIHLLRRFADEVLVMFDADTAGMAAAERGLDLFFEEELPARVITLEAGLDPCDYLVERGPEAFAERVKAATDLFDFKLAAVRAGHDLDTAHGRRAAVRALMSTVARVEDPVMAAELRRRAAEAFGLPEEVLAAELAGGVRPARRSRPEQVEAVKLSRRHQAERELVRALACYPPGMFEARRELEEFSQVRDTVAAEVLSVAARVYEDLGELNLEEVATCLTLPEAVSLVADVAAGMENFAPSDPAAAVFRVLVDLKRIDLEEELAQLGEEMRRADPDRQVVIADRITELKREEQKLGARAAVGEETEEVEG